MLVKRTIVCLLLLLTIPLTCFADLQYVGKDAEYSDYYFSPNVEVLSSEKDKFIFTAYIKAVLSNNARNRMRFSKYDNDLCYPYPANMATTLVMKYRFKKTKDKIQYRQENYILLDGNDNILGSDLQTKYYHTLTSDKMIYDIYYAIVRYELGQK